MLKYALSGISTVILILVVFIASRPDDFRVERSAIINAPVSSVFPYFNNLHKFQEWSPWAKLDPNAKIRFEGPDEGTGSVFYWSGNNNIGEGSMKSLDSNKDELIRYQLDFVKPFKGTNEVVYTFKADDKDKTTVTWVMSGKANFISKAMSLVMDCDRMVGEQVEQGFANLKAIVEKK